MFCSLYLYRYRYARHPHVFLVVAVCNPQVLVRRCSVAFQYASCILRSVALVVAPVAFRRNLAVHQVERCVFQSVVAQRYCKRPAIFSRVIYSGISAIRKALSPYLRVRVHKAVSPLCRFSPCVSAVAAYACQRVLPQSHLASVGQGISAERLVRSLQRQYVVVSVCLFNPLHSVHRVSQNLVAGLNKLLVLCFLVVRIVGVLFVKSVVIIYKVYRTECSVGLYLSYHAAYSVAVVGVVFRSERHAVVAHCNETVALRHIEAHALVHDGLQVFCHNARPCRFCVSVGHVVFREQLNGLSPFVSVYRSLQHGLSGRLMLASRVGQVVHVELAFPVCHHGLMVIEPSLFASHGLNAVNSHHGRQSAVMSCRRCHGCAGVVNGVAVLLYQVLHNFLVSHEHRSVLVSYREFYGTCLVLEVLEVLCPCRSVYAVAVRVVVDVIPSVDHCR